MLAYDRRWLHDYLIADNEAGDDSRSGAARFTVASSDSPFPMFICWRGGLLFPISLRRPAASDITTLKLHFCNGDNWRPDGNQYFS